MSGIVSRWPVAQTHRVERRDLDDDGVVRAEVLERWISDACSAYLDQCSALRDVATASGLAIAPCISSPAVAALAGHPARVVVTAGATEFRPSSFTVAVRVRSGGGTDDAVINATCEVELVDHAGNAHDLGDAIRDELIALAHSARYTN